MRAVLVPMAGSATLEAIGADGKPRPPVSIGYEPEGGLPILGTA